MKNRINIIKILCVVLISFFGLKVNAQQDPMYTQYMFNTQSINPAYAGTWESVGFIALARQQWTGFSGAPQTYTFSAQVPFKNEKTALGLNIISDKLGLEKRFLMFGDYSHMVQIDDRNKLRLGLKAGLTNYSNNFTEYSIIDPNDPNFLIDVSNKITPNFGVGAFLYDNERYYIGISVPKILNHDITTENATFSPELRHYYLIAGLVFDLNEYVKFKPTVLTKAAFGKDYGTPVQLDLTGNFLIVERFWIGAMYRTDKSFGGIAQWIIDKKLRIGYAYDYSTQLKGYQNGTHEIMISYELKFLKESVVSPRYF